MSDFTDTLRPTLSKEQIAAILDCPYGTGYTYASSIAYRRFLGTKNYEHPRLCRPYTSPTTLHASLTNYSIQQKEWKLNYPFWLMAFMLMVSLFILTSCLIQCQGILPIICKNPAFFIRSTEVLHDNVEFVRMNSTINEGRNSSETFLNQYCEPNMLHSSDINATALAIYYPQPLTNMNNEMVAISVKHLFRSGSGIGRALQLSNTTSNMFCPTRPQTIENSGLGFCLAFDHSEQENLTAKRTLSWKITIEIRLLKYRISYKPSWYPGQRTLLSFSITLPKPRSP